jgi:hypothetical protein
MATRWIIQAVCLLAAGALRAQAPDSLRAALLRLAVREAEIEAARTDVWHRLMPRVEIGAGFSAGNLLFADPAQGAAYLLPRDSYRLTLGLSLSGLVDASAHERALVHQERARAEMLRDSAAAAAARAAAVARAARRDSVRAIEGEELRLREELARYQRLLFEQGKGGFDALARARLSVLEARAAALRRELPGAAGREEP